MTRVRTADGGPDDARLVVDYGPVNPPPTAAPGDDGWRTNADAGPAALEVLLLGGLAGILSGGQ
jgi:hypothetical protein